MRWELGLVGAHWEPGASGAVRGCWGQQGPALSGGLILGKSPGLLETTDLRVSQRPVFEGGHRGPPRVSELVY